MDFIKLLFGDLGGEKTKSVKAEIDAKLARAITDSVRGETDSLEEYKRSDYLLRCVTKIKHAALSGRNMSFFPASTFKSYGGIEYFEKLGYKVYFVNGGMYDSDDYRVEW